MQFSVSNVWSNNKDLRISDISTWTGMNGGLVQNCLAAEVEIRIKSNKFLAFLVVFNGQAKNRLEF